MQQSEAVLPFARLLPAVSLCLVALHGRVAHGGTQRDAHQAVFLSCLLVANLKIL